MDQGSTGSDAQGPSGAMNYRLIVGMAVIGAIVVGVIGYAVGVGNQDTGLTAEQRNEIETMVSQALESETDEASPVTEVAELGEGRRGVIEVLIRTHLLANPDIITDAIDELRAQEEQAESAAVGDAIVTNAAMIFDSDRQVVMGNPDGDVTLVEFFDCNCPYCRRSATDIQQLIEEDPGLRVVLKEFPVLEEGSVEAARVAVAIKMTALDKYQAFHLALLSEPGTVNGERAMAVAEDVGIDPETLRPLLESPEVADTINEVYELADMLRVNGTPTFVTVKEVMFGGIELDVLRTKIAEARSN